MGGGLLLAGGGVWAVRHGRTDCSQPEAQQAARESAQCVQAQAEGSPDAPELCACHARSSGGSSSGGGGYGGYSRSGYHSTSFFGSGSSRSSGGGGSAASGVSRGGFGGFGASHSSGS